MKIYTKSIICGILSVIIAACSGNEEPKAPANQGPAPVGQAGVKDDKSQKNVVRIAAESPDHSTLVAAVKAGELLDALSNAGPFTVFAPTNAAFDKLPKGTVETLLKPENKGKLVDILQHHVAVSVYTDALLTDGKIINMVDGKNVKITRKDGNIYIDKAKIAGSARASNGIVYIIDEVVLPPEK